VHLPHDRAPIARRATENIFCMSAAHERHLASALACANESRYMKRKNEWWGRSGSQEQRTCAMLPTVIYLIEAIRRALKKSSRGVFMLVDVFGEAMEDWRKARRKYPFAE